MNSTGGHNFLQMVYQKLLSDASRNWGEKAILSIAIVSFLVHLGLIYLVQWEWISLPGGAELLSNPIAAIYTPFSFILLYEVYLLIFYLPKSITTYISKQYEIITLIVIRRLFKDLSNLSLTSDWFQSKYDLQFTYDLLTSIVLFFCIYLFNVQSSRRYTRLSENGTEAAGIERFIKLKKIIATALVPLFIILAIYSFGHWGLGLLQASESGSFPFKNINNIFFEQFFTILIFADVILLLFSFFHTDEFHKVIRNSGFVISTILLRISFSVTGLLNTALIVAAMVFGLLILFIHNRFEKHLSNPNHPS
jgi:hypothetical protein